MKGEVQYEKCIESIEKYKDVWYMVYCMTDHEGGYDTVIYCSECGKELTYTIDTATGNGTDSTGHEVDLPQTGVAALPHGIMVILALLMLLSGFVLLLLSAKQMRKRPE